MIKTFTAYSNDVWLTYIKVRLAADITYDSLLNTSNVVYHLQATSGNTANYNRAQIREHTTTPNLIINGVERVSSFSTRYEVNAVPGSWANVRYNSGELSWSDSNVQHNADGTLTITATIRARLGYNGNLYGLVSGQFTINVSESVPSYMVEFNANGGTDAPAATEIFRSVSTPLTTQAPNRSGFKFLGWSTSPDATAPAFFPGSSITITSAVTLFAVWKVEAVVFRSDGRVRAMFEMLISNGQTFESYEAYISDGTQWVLYKGAK